MTAGTPNKQPGYRDGATPGLLYLLLIRFDRLTLLFRRSSTGWVTPRALAALQERNKCIAEAALCALSYSHFTSRSMTKSLPAHWPSEISFLHAPSYSSSIPPYILSDIRGVGPTVRSGPSKHVVIRHITARDHPACGQYGLFAARTIMPNSHICDYLGEVHIEDRTSEYDLSLLRLPDGINVGVDACTMGNETRFVNDYRGIQSKPNIVFKEQRTASGELRMSIWSASTRIRKGEELLVSYGKSWWRYRLPVRDTT